MSDNLQNEVEMRLNTEWRHLCRIAAEVQKKLDALSIWSAEEQERLRPEVLRPLQQAIGDANAAAALAEGKAELLEASASADPLAELDNETLQRMTLLWPFVEHDIANLFGTGALAQRLVAVGQQNDKALQVMYWRLARAWAGESKGVAHALDELERILFGARADKAAQNLAKAQEWRRAAHKLRVEARETLDELDGYRAEANVKQIAGYDIPF